MTSRFDSPPDKKAISLNPSANTTDSRFLASQVFESLSDSKAQDIVTLSVRDYSSISDFLIIATGTSHRHVGSVSDRLLRDLKNWGYGSVSVEGLPSCDWVLLDIGDVIVHIFRPEVREFYDLEKMWGVPVPDTLTE